MRRSIAGAALLALAAPLAHSQTPSPLQEWQYSAGIPLQKMFEPTVPDWRVIVGAGSEVRPIYDGAAAYRVVGGPVFNVQYQDIAFFSVGEGVGVNFVDSGHVRLGASVGYDLGRRVADEYSILTGLGNISPAPVAKLFGSYVVSKKFPLVIRTDIRRVVGGNEGLLGDIEAYMPLPGSSKKLVMFAGPSITFADHTYFQRVFGVTASQSIASGYPVFDTHGGTAAVGLGFSATRFLSTRWLIDVDAAINHLRGSADESPITQKSTQHAVSISVAYVWK